jgi:phospholipase C
MSASDRRTFLKQMGSGALAASLPASIARAMAIPANNRTRSIADVEHIVILMQENRSFDHYFGKLRGVRGFSDPRAVTLPSGQPVWNQPNGAGYLLPFRPPVADVGMTFLPDPPHGWNDTHAAWNSGNHDQWVPNKGVTTMTYHTRQDLPFYYALVDAFTICDNYHCSLLGPTDPNRYHMWTGWVGNDGQAGGPVITNAEAGYDWSTYPERLQRAGITWKVYQDVGVGLNAAGYWGWTEDAFIGNYGDNSLLYFHQYQNAPAGSPLAVNARTGTNILASNRDPEGLFTILREDVRKRKLPQVSWIVAPEAYCEHPNWAPDYGAWYVSQVIDILTSDPDLWSKTALLINFDEEGGFFDHLVPPTPPRTRSEGLSTVPITNEIFPGDAGHPSGPYGLGMRVPMIVVSPWSKGGWVNSQVFDHTSVIRFLEARFADRHPGLIETNITPWRRAVAGDLTTAFDFRKPESWRNVSLPNTDDDEPEDLERQPDDVPVPPADQKLPKQERGVRLARALPYNLHAHGTANAGNGSFLIQFGNVGEAAAVFQVRSGNNQDPPRTYTVEPQKQVSDSWNIGGSGYDLSVYGPNGFFRAFKGGLSGNRAMLDVRASYERHDNGITLTISNRNAQSAKVRIRDEYTGKSTDGTLRRGESMSRHWTLSRFYGWYDLTITVDQDPGFECELAGHVEDGDDSISDPLMGGLV